MATYNGTAGADSINRSLDTTANLINGLAGNDTLRGGSGHDTLDGGTGNDSMVGGAGNDTYIVDSTLDKVVENAGGGIDTILSSVNLNLLTFAAQVENLALTGTALSATGNTLNNVLTGNALANTLSGDAGNDTLIGGAGNDTLLGGTGHDSLDGGSGTDSLVGGDGNDTYRVTAQDLIVESGTAGAGIDTAITEAGESCTLGANVENLVANGSYGGGNALNNLITGANLVNQQLDGQAGNDTIVGVGDRALIRGGGGNDSLVGGSGNDYIEGDSGTAEPYTADGNDTLRGGAGNDTLIGGGGNDTLYGESGDDSLEGGTGTNWLIGGAGNDTYNLASQAAASTISESFYGADDGGIDTIVCQSGSFTLGANFENLQLTSWTDAVGTGNALNNRLEGGFGQDTLIGGTGDDTLFGGIGSIDTLLGGDGDDVYIVDQLEDLVVETGASDQGDQIEAMVSYSLVGHDTIEELRLHDFPGAPLDLNGTGNALDNTLYGNRGNNLLDGGLGNDILFGDAGSDTYLIDSADDQVWEFDTWDNGDADKIISGLAIDLDQFLTSGVEIAELTGTANVNATGNALNNTLSGNQGHNVLTGGLGEDTLNGAGGNDTLLGGLAGDTYIATGNFGADVITDQDTSTVDLANHVNVDELHFQSAGRDQLWFTQKGLDLEISVVGSANKATVTAWFNGNANQVELILDDVGGYALAASRVNALVGAMSQFTPQNMSSAQAPAALLNARDAAWLPA